VEDSKHRAQSLWNKLFGDPVRAFGSLSLLFLISLAIAPSKDHFSQWRHYQNSYLKMIRGRGDAVTLRRHFQDGIQQIWIPELGVVDRCTSCHVGVKEASLTDVSLPFRRHPVIPHNVDQFGCVMCHRGQGAATTVEEAHMSTLAWEEPMLPERYIESSCGQCHHASLVGTPQLNEGRRLMARYGCVHCHTVKLPEGGSLKAEDDAPSLSHIADKTTREWIYAWLKDPQAYAASAKMPSFKLSDGEARDIAAFLMANSTPVSGDRLALPQSAASDPTAGASLYGESFCATLSAVTSVQNSRESGLR
jgi:Cytochrome c